MKNKTIYTAIILFVLFIIYFNKGWILTNLSSPASNQAESEVTLNFPSDRYPETAAHIKAAIEHEKSSICTIDRKGAEANRKESLRGVPVKPNLDRDEFPMAMCEEGGKGADIMHISPSDNRGAGAWVSNQLDKYPDGTRVKIVVK
ncbi:NucA/NucB deoxyribonuclease domain-containing protein [Paenibacillus sp. MZ04-78.2]|uniref:NucA/NucB deoxyribonuclease domain-containing protein n=1 Tax=Paenibacillus sp. MZ04-78.2 TaxID=2962034 RepID=UPI0020B73470|nr:NucA/NucB deoxyribonuclease domain-containing protein [Paenibacillus sp. MZ04-78.2]MCP3772301.1 NucA/NucB deoxyribonuclease domain-containing protein [Paenibacillus sp. MZ04-78.2]